MDVDDCREISPVRGRAFWRLRLSLRENALPKDEDCNGFFFGSPQQWSEDREAGAKYAETFERAAAWVSRGAWRSVYYQGSW
jgi:hypothetical protein